MADIRMLQGNAAAGYGAKLARVQLGVFFPIGPSDEVIETYRELIDRGEVEGPAEVIQMQNEQGDISAMSAANRLGVRSMWAGCDGSVPYAIYPIYNATSERATFMMVIPGRSVGFPGGVSSDLQDSLSLRDVGCLIFYCEDGQDILDTVIQGYRIAEDARVRLPIVVGFEGWNVGHSIYRVDLPPQEAVDSFLPKLTIPAEDDLLTVDYNALTSVRRQRYVEGLAGSDYYMEYRFKMAEAMNAAKSVAEEAGQEYARLFGRGYVGLIEKQAADDADVLLVTMGGVTGTARFVVESMRKEGAKVGLVKVRSFRPFPKEALRAALNAPVVVTIEPDHTGCLFEEVRSALYGIPNQPTVLGRIVGVGGKEVSYYDMANIALQGLAVAAGQKVEDELAWEPIASAEREKEGVA